MSIIDDQLFRLESKLTEMISSQEISFRNEILNKTINFETDVKI